MDGNRVRAGFAALGNVTRYRMVELLAHAGVEGSTPGALADAVGVQRNLLGAHLLILEKAGLVTAKKIGRNRVCRLDAAAFRILAAAADGYADSAKGSASRP